MTLILETPKSDIHRCPACGAQCAVERDLMALARDAGQRIRVACHKCDEVFQPLNDNVSTDILPGAAQPSRPNPNPRVGVCSTCGGSFSVPPLAAGEAVMVECPHCRHLMQPDEVGHADVMDEFAGIMQPPSKLQKRAGTVLALLLAGALLAGFAAMAIFKITPMPTPFGLDAVSAPHFAVTEARFDSALDGADGAILVTVGFANLGTAPARRSGSSSVFWTPPANPSSHGRSPSAKRRAGGRDADSQNVGNAGRVIAISPYPCRRRTEGLAPVRNDLVARLLRLVIENFRRKAGARMSRPVASSSRRMMFGDHSLGPYRAAPSLKISIIFGEISSGTPARSASSWNRLMSLMTRSIVKLMSRLPFRITWLSVSWTKEFPDEMRIAS